VRNRDKVYRYLVALPELYQLTTTEEGVRYLKWKAKTICEDITTPDHWAESVKMADEMGHEIIVHKSTYHLGIFDYDKDKFMYSGPFTLPELHEKLKELTND
jgi:hypothetical protein